MHFAITGVYVQFSQEQYVAYDRVAIKVTVNGDRKFQVSIRLRIFISSKLQPKPGKY